MSTTIPTIARLDHMTVEHYMHPVWSRATRPHARRCVARILSDERIHCVVVAGIDTTQQRRAPDLGHAHRP